MYQILIEWLLCIGLFVFIVGLFKVYIVVYDTVYNLKEHDFLIMMITLKTDESYLEVQSFAIEDDHLSIWKDKMVLLKWNMSR